MKPSHKTYLQNDQLVHSVAILERDKSETPAPASVLISLELTLGDLAVLFEE